MGKIVLYWTAAFVLGGLMVAIPMCIGLTGYVLMTEPGEFSPEAFLNAVLTGFVIYLALVWATQETFEEKFGIVSRMLLFIILPITVMYFHAEWNLTICMGALAFIASLAAYQMLVTVVAKHSWTTP
jgi:hypothetical protein